MIMSKKVICAYLFSIINLCALGVYAHEGTTSGIAPDLSPVSTQSFKEVGDLTKELRRSSKKLNDLKQKRGSGVVSQKEISRLLEIAKKRKVIMLDLAKKDPKSFVGQAFKKNDKAALPAVVQAEIEDEKSFTGSLDVVHVDDFKKPENSYFTYSIYSPDKAKLSLVSAQALPAVSSGVVVKVKGFQIDSVFVAHAPGGLGGVQVVQAAPPVESIGEQKVLVVLTTFKDSGPVDFKPVKIKDLIFNGQIQNFYKEQSYNQVNFSGDVTDWIAINKNFSGGVCGSVSIDDRFENKEIQDYINNKNIDLRKYGRIVYIVANNYVDGGGCSMVGKSDNLVFNSTNYRVSEAWVGLTPGSSGHSSDHPFSWSYFDYVFSHEMGHSLGVMHANSWACVGQSLYGECQHIEYGNYFDTMGGGVRSLHFNAFYKELLGWLEPNSKRLLTITQSGTYYLSPLESATGTVAAKIINPANSEYKGVDFPFYLEYRQPIGFDAGIKNPQLGNVDNGLLVNQVIHEYSKTSTPHPRLIDATPNDGDYNPTVGPGVVLDDPGRGVKIHSVSRKKGGLIGFNVDLKTPTCQYREPTVTGLYYSTQLSVGGAPGSASFLIRNNNYFGCGLGNFLITVEPATVWTYEVNPGANISVHSNGLKIVDISIRSVPDLARGSYPLRVVIKDLNSGKIKVIEQVVKFVGNPQIQDIVPNNGPIGTTVTLKGVDFGKNTETEFENTVYVLGDTGEMILSGTPDAEGKTLTFKFPDSMLDFKTNSSVPVLPGVYDIMAYTNGAYTNSVKFTVTSTSTPPIGVGTPISNLQRKSGLWKKNKNLVK